MTFGEFTCLLFSPFPFCVDETHTRGSPRICQRVDAPATLHDSKNHQALLIRSPHHQHDIHALSHGRHQGFYDLGMPSAIDVDPTSVQTNIVLVTVGPDLTDEGVTAAVVCERLKAKGVLAMAIMKGVIRFVTHSQVTRGSEA